MGGDFYIPFSMSIRLAHFQYLKRTYDFSDEQILKSYELDDLFVL
jgi:hypothetical protein